MRSVAPPQSPTWRTSILPTGVPEIGDLEIWSSERGLAAILFTGDRRSVASRRWVAKRSESAEPAPPGAHADWEAAISEFLDGSRMRFDLPIDLACTPFQRAVLEAVRRIPYGETATYAEIATAAGNPKAVRAAGAANGANPIPLVIPCHRVVGASGRLTGYGGGLDAKQWLLELESGQARLALERAS